MASSDITRSLPIRIAGTGIYLPGEPIDNTELQAKTGVAFDAHKLEQKLGIYRRHIARVRGIEESTADFATRAAEAALADAGVRAGEIGLIIVGTDTPEYISPCTALLVQGRLQGGERAANVFDVNASCASFCRALDLAAHLMTADTRIRHALVIGVYNMPAFVRPDDAFGISIFADGAGAFVLSRDTNGGAAYLAGDHISDGTQWDYIGIYTGGSHRPCSPELLSAGTYGLQNLQPLPGDRNVRLWPAMVERLLATAALQPAAVHHFIFTQINRAVIEHVMQLLDQPLSKTTLSMDRYGYTGSACVPIAFHTAVQAGSIRRGDTVLLVASGAGLAVSGNLLVY
jgi:3-oxoacyl-[acyl-carrier-protein] synthase-3